MGEAGPHAVRVAAVAGAGAEAGVGARLGDRIQYYYTGYRIIIPG